MNEHELRLLTVDDDISRLSGELLLQLVRTRGGNTATNQLEDLARVARGLAEICWGQKQ